VTEQIETRDLLAALQRSVERHKAASAEAQLAQEPRSTPSDGEDSHPGSPEGAQRQSVPYGWVLVDNVTRRVLSPAPTREGARETVRRWDETYPSSAGRYSVARLIPDDAR